jgi:pyruvate,water dikinase
MKYRKGVFLMGNMIKNFKEFTTELQPFAGGKGAMLARMYQEGYPVPDGLLVLPAAYQEEAQKHEALEEIQSNFKVIRNRHQRARFSVR